MKGLDAAKCLALLIASGCAESGSEAVGSAGDERAFVPEELSNSEANGAEGGLTLSAFTLVESERGLDLYAAARNEAETPVCEPGMTTDFVDRDGRLVGSAGMTLHSGHFYRIEDGSGAIVTCVPPGGTAMGVSQALPEAIVVDDLAFLRHSFPAFLVANLVPVSGLTLRDVEPVERDAGIAYAGTLNNELELSIANPRVTVFPLNRVGRPLAMLSTEATLTIPAGQTWSFETSAENALGAGHAAFPIASIIY